MAKIYLSSIAAMASNNAIGKDNALLWHIPEDLQHFKKTTMGKPLVMGRKTYESLGKPLPGRPHIVISRSHTDLPAGAPTPLYKEMESGDPAAPKINVGPFLHATIEGGIRAAKDIAEKMGVDEIMVVGGGEIYKQTLPLIDRLYLTVVHKDYAGDTYFPDFDWDDWRIVTEDKHAGDPAFTFFTLERDR